MAKKLKTIKKPELIAPAGGWSALKGAVEAGADAVYFGVKDINMRRSADNFDVFEIKKVMDFLRQNGRKGYLALNVIVYDNELGRVRQILTAAKEHDVDAVILWDMAIFSIAKENGLRVHLSTQASVANFESLKHYSEQGVRRIVLARECGLTDIKKMARRIIEEKIECDIETFIHGAMCVSISGRCFLSQYTFGKSANRGECIQPCRRKFAVADEDDESKYVVGKDYVLSPRDLCALDFIDELVKSGISAFKIEGRMRPPEYVSVVTHVYRTAINAVVEGRWNEKLKKELLDRLRSTFNRGFSTGFYLGQAKDLGGTPQKEYKKVYLGEVIKFYRKISVAEIIVRSAELRLGQKILITGKKTPAGFAVADEMQMDHKFVDVVLRGQSVGIKLPFETRPKDKVFLWVTRSS